LFLENVTRRGGNMSDIFLSQFPNIAPPIPGAELLAATQEKIAQVAAFVATVLRRGVDIMYRQGDSPPSKPPAGGGSDAGESDAMKKIHETMDRNKCGSCGGNGCAVCHPNN
jgi:hypothetical protein